MLLTRRGIGPLANVNNCEANRGALLPGLRAFGSERDRPAGADRGRARARIFHLTRALDFAKMPEVIAWLEAHWLELRLMEQAA